MKTAAPGGAGRDVRILPAPDFVRTMSERALRVTVWSLSIGVVGAVVLLVSFPRVLAIEGLDVSALPGFHATLNAMVSLLLVAGYLQVRAGRLRGHQASMLAAFLLSCLFLASYVVYHSQATGASFGGEGWIRPVYFFVLITHVVLAPVIVPLALFAILRGLRGELRRHRRVARWTLPLWLYVAVTGVLVYLMMAPYYGH